MEILKAEIEDLPQILSLQKLAYQSEAILVNDFSIPPLTQTLESIENDYKSGIILKAADENIIIGSVRGKKIGDTAYFGKLIVNPDFQNRGIGTKLLLAVEKYFPKMRYGIFTSNLSEKNLAIYQKNGYIEFKREKYSDNFDFVFLYKPGDANND
ncbi:MAG: GNAT family N-acetyltransferase [Clostridiales bacterium]|jgi:GNAT superfamily N-acetyltransferase|nr:GNAT family N-acetyltransferase [Clostridiales bacterium]